LPETLDGTYEQSLRRIDKQKRDFACRLFQCLVVSKRPLRVEELAELFAIQPDVDTIPTFDVRCRPENPEEFVLSACSTLVAVVNNRGQKIVQFSHFSVREYLTSDRIAISEHVSRFHVLPRPAHALLARACLSVLLQLSDRIVRDKIRNFPLASYAARYWVGHAQFENVSSGIQHSMEALFDKDKPHLAAWLRLCNLDTYSSTPRARSVAQPYSVPLYYAALCGFRDLTDHLLNAHPQHVNARGGTRATPLHAAVDKGHLSTAMLLLQRGADIGSRDFANRTPLHIASYRGHAEVVSLLIDCGANPNAESDKRETPLFLASRYGRHGAARLLLEHSADANYQNAEGLTPLRAAWKKGHIDNVRLLLDYGADAKSPDNRGKSPLHVVLQEGHEGVYPTGRPSLKPNSALSQHRLDIVILLLEHGADANYSDNHGQTPLHIALWKGLIDIARLLLNHGADANSPDNRGKSPLHVVLQGDYKGLEDILLLYRTYPTGRPSLKPNSAFFHHTLDIVMLLLEHGADANYSDNLGQTPLHIALRKGLIDIVRLLLNHGADANSLDNRGMSPLHVVLQEVYSRDTLFLDAANPRSHGLNPVQRLDIVMLLLKHGADANYPGNHGETPLHIALREGLIGTTRLLLNHGKTPVHDADEIIRLLFGLPGGNSWTSLHAASQEGHDDIVRSYLNHGVDANYPDSDGWTALHAASQEGHSDIVRLLLNHGADANRSDNDGWSPLHAASQEGHDTVVRLLLDHGAAADHPDTDGWTPLHAASKEGHDDIVRLLLDRGAAPNQQRQDSVRW
jgi:ankyrin repeat protein